MYLVILGASKCKSEEEKTQEDDEQANALKEAKRIIEERKKK